MDLHTRYSQFCRGLKAKSEWRELTVFDPSGPGQIRRGVEDLINFSSNDYLGLSRSRQLRMRAISFAQQYGAGSTASRLMTGNLRFFDDVESKLAAAIGTESVLIFNSGYQANATILAALMDRAVLGMDAVVFADRLNHNSLIKGVQLAGAEMQRYRHLDLNHLESILEKSKDRKIARFIVSETLFGMDGDCADIPALIALAKKYDAFLFLDDAHAAGVLGKNGFGLAAEYADDVDMIMGTFGKAYGSFGAYIACRRELREYLINRCGGFMFSTALPPMVMGAVDAAIDMIPTLGLERAKLLANADYLRSAIKPLGIDCGQSNAHIVPMIVGSADRTISMQKQLEQNGVLALAIRPPTVPSNTSRLRLSMTAAHSTAQVDQLIEALYQIHKSARISVAA